MVFFRCAPSNSIKKKKTTLPPPIPLPPKFLAAKMSLSRQMLSRCMSPAHLSLYPGRAVAYRVRIGMQQLAAANAMQFIPRVDNR
jgi:hypothetical protein